MRNLKKVLALVLAMAMALSLAVTAGAAYKTFPDQGEIQNEEAVFLLNALGIVEGRDNGEFDPTANLNRAEAAKLIAALNLAGVPVPEANGISTFTDVLGDGSVAWANDFIEYCVAQGSVNGVGNDLFAPKAKVTGVQFAKMLLGILGYDAETEKFVGASWEYYTNTAAVKAGLYIGLDDIDFTAPLSRDDAAQMMYNALKAKTVIYLTDTTGALKLTNKNLLETIYPTVYGNQGKMTAIKYNTDKGEYTYYIDGKALEKTTSADYTDMLGMNVMYVMDRIDGVLGVYAYDNGAVSTGLVGDYDYDKLIDDKLVDTNAKVYEFKATCDGTIHLVALSDAINVASADPYDTYKAIDNDNDGDIDVTIVYPVEYAQVATVKTDYFMVKGQETQFDFDHSTVYAGIAKDDYALFSVDTSLKTMGTVSKLVAQYGVIDSMSSTKVDGMYEVVISGTAYDITDGAARSIIDPMDWAGKKVEFYEINGYVVIISRDYSLNRDFLLVTAIDGDHNADGYSVNATALLPDNTSEVITIASLEDHNGVQEGFDIIEAMLPYLDQSKDNEQHGYLAYFEVVDGKYELTSTYALDQLVAQEKADLDFVKTYATYNDDSLSFIPAVNNEKEAYVMTEDGARLIADDAVVFVADVSGVGDGKAVKYSVKTGADIAHLTGWTTVYYAGVEKNDTTNYTEVTFAFIATDNASKSADITGILTSNVTYYVGAEDNYAYFTMWNGEENVTMHAKLYPGVNTTNLTKGTVIICSVDAGKIVQLKPTFGYTGAITEYDAAREAISFGHGLPMTIDETTEIFYFDTSEDVAVDGAIAFAHEDVHNAYYVDADFDGVIDILVVDPDAVGGIKMNTINTTMP